MKFPKSLELKLEQRIKQDSLRSLTNSNQGIDFFSNDYLGFSQSKDIFENAHQFLIEENLCSNGSTGSRLLSGNHKLYELVENSISKFYQIESALIFNSGYDANLGLFSTLPQKNDLIIYDELSHASIRDGILLSHAKSIKFKHNNLGDLEDKISRLNSTVNNVYVVTESVFSMDGDIAPLSELAEFCSAHQLYLIVDEAHALGVYGNNGKGLVDELNLSDKVFAQIITFGKALGCHGAAIIGSEKLKEYVLNFARSFIYTTALPPHSLATIYFAIEALKTTDNHTKLKSNIDFFNSEIKLLNLEHKFIPSHSAIHCCVLNSVDKVKSISTHLKTNNFDVKPILYPTVAKGMERLRICIHSFNSKNEISELLKMVKESLD